MQSLNSTCQEADYLLGDGFCTFKKPALKPQSKLLVKRYSNVSSLPPPSVPSSSSSQSSSLSQQQSTSSSSLYGSSSSKSNSQSSRSSTSSKNGKKGGSSNSIVGGSPPKKSKFSSSTSTSATLPLHSSSSSSSSTNGGGSSSSSTQTSTSSYDIHDRLKTLHMELLREDNSLKNMLSLRCTSFLLEKLIARDKLNSLILNLYPGNKGYSLAFRLDKKTTELTNSQENPSGGSSSNSLINNKNTSKTGAASLSSSSSNNKLNSNSNVNISNNENLQETMRWPYEDEDLLESIDNEELPLILVDIIEKKCPHLFYSGCVIAEIRDYRQSFPIYTCDTSHVLLKPTNQTLFADVNLITSEGNWSAEDKLRLESQLVLATAQPLCLDPNPNIGIISINHQHTRNLLNTPSIRRQSKKFSQVAINRKRKLDQFTHNYGLELSDFMQKYRKRTSSKQTSTGTSNIGTSNYPRKATDIQPIRTPNLDLPASLTIPEEINVEKFAKTFERPRETKDCQPQLIEQYILETDRADKQTYHIKLSLYQRPSNYEFLGELYVDKNHRDGERNGEACQFSLGTRAHANRYIQQFTEIFTEEGRKSVKITHYIPGQPPRISCTARMWEHRIQQQAAIQQQQQLQQQQVIQQLNPIQPQLNNATPTPQQIISAGPSTNIINIRQTPQPQVNPPMYQNCTTQVIQQQQQQQQPQQQPQQVQQQLQQTTQITAASGPQLTQLNLNNNRPVLLVKPPIGNITNLTINTQSNQQARATMGTPVPVLQAQLQSHTIQSPQQIQQIQQQTPEPLTPTIHSTNPEINALATGLMNSANQFQQRFAAAKSRQQLQQQQQQQHQQQQQQQRQQQIPGGSSNAAIISLLNSAPAAMTNSPVLSNNQVAVENLMARKPTVENTILQTQQLPQKLFSTTTGNPTSVRKLSTNLQTTQQQQQGLSRILNHSNLIAVSSVGNQTQLINVQQQPDGSYQQTGNDRVSLSALASQLASPPAVMTSPIIQQTQTIQNNQNYTVNSFPQQGSITKQVLINSVNPRLLATQGGNTILHRESSVTSPGSDSNASSSSTIGYSMSGLNALLATSPSPVSIDLNSNNSNSALIERLTSPSSTLSGQFTAPSPKNINIQQQSQQQQQQHIQVQSPASISPMSSPPPPQQQQPQTTTLNLQGLNLASLQGAISTIPGLQNVQVQIPGISQPISLSLSGPTNTNASLTQPTSLLVSVPVTNTTQVNQIQSIPSSGATQTVVLTNAQPGTGGGSNLLSLPIAQFVTTSNVKGLNQQTIRTTNSGNQPFQLVGTIQRPRGIQVAGSSLINTKQLSARTLVSTPQRGSTLKITTPISAASSQLQSNLQGNHIVMSAAQQQLQLKLQKQLQQQCNNAAASGMPQIMTKSQVGTITSTNQGSNVGAINVVNSVITAALQGNHRRRSGTETNK